MSGPAQHRSDSHDDDGGPAQGAHDSQAINGGPARRERIRKIVDGMPPLTGEQRDRLALLLHPGGK